MFEPLGGTGTSRDPRGVLSSEARELRGAPWGLVTLKGSFLESS